MTDLNEQSSDVENDFKVCKGLTDEQRREIRKSQRELRKAIPDLDIEEGRRRNNEINATVRYVREAVLDADNVHEIVKKASDKADQMIQVSRQWNFAVLSVEIGVAISCTFFILYANTSSFKPQITMMV